MKHWTFKIRCMSEIDSQPVSAAPQWPKNKKGYFSPDWSSLRNTSNYTLGFYKFTRGGFHFEGVFELDASQISCSVE